MVRREMLLDLEVNYYFAEGVGLGWSVGWGWFGLVGWGWFGLVGLVRNELRTLRVGWVTCYPRGKKPGALLI